MDYLTTLGFTKEDILSLEVKEDEKVLRYLKENKESVLEIIEYFISYGISNYIDVVLSNPLNVCYPISYLKKRLLDWEQTELLKTLEQNPYIEF